MIFILFPIHLFSDIEYLKNKKVYLIEDPTYFSDFKYHKLKLAYHRSTMKYYNHYLKDNNINIEYIDFYDAKPSFYKSFKNKDVFMYDPNDHHLLKKMKKYIPNINILDTLNFLVNEKLIKENLSTFYNGKKYNHQNFYKWQRIRLNILVKNNQPIGGKWSFDDENREKLPSNVKIPNITQNYTHLEKNIIKDAIEYVNKYFPNNYGDLDNFIYPISHKSSMNWLIDFLKNRFQNFGKYEDAVSERSPFLFHSILTPIMNIGLLTDHEVIKETLKYINKVKISSFEGFIRQIIGWRNYIYTIYILEGTKLPKMNFFKHTRKINYDRMWNGKTDILPIDNIIIKIKKYAYAHHIERLMYLGLYMLLCMIKPKDVYKMFMEWTIDAYEWVMVPNVYGMSQYADGGLMMTKPYIASYNYILHMSNYKKEDWCFTLEALYYHFINKHKDYLKKNYSTSRQVSHWNKKTNLEKKNLLNHAKKYLSKYF